MAGSIHDKTIARSNDSDCPPFDDQKYLLGSLCAKRHEWGCTGKSLRIPRGNKARPCVACETEIKQQRYLKKKSEKRILNRVILPVTIFHESGLTSFDFQSFSLETHIRKPINLDHSIFASEKVCKHGHFWIDSAHSLRYNSSPNNCYVCGNQRQIKEINSGKAAAKSAALYVKNKEKHNRVIMRNYYRNHEAKKQLGRDNDSRIRALVASGELALTYEGNECKKCKTTQKYTLKSNCVQCAKNRSLKRSRLTKYLNHSAPYSEDEELVHRGKFQDKCAYCGKNVDTKALRSWAWDHFLPAIHGGTNGLSNFVFACTYCNASKCSKDPWEWYQKESFFSLKRWKLILKILGKTQKNYLELPLF